MYARFFTKALADLGYVPKDLREPFRRLFTQGMVRLGGGKMSKSRGNLVAPEEIVDAEQGADALRLAILQAKPPAEDVDWEDFAIEGAGRFLARLVAAGHPRQRPGATGPVTATAPRPTRPSTARPTSCSTGSQATTTAGRFNTAVAAAMEFTNELYRYVQSDEGPHGETLADAVDTLLLVLAPPVPHITGELWERRHGDHIHERAWPVADPDSAGRRDRHDGGAGQRQRSATASRSSTDVSEADAEALALAAEGVQRHLDGTAEEGHRAPATTGQHRRVTLRHSERKPVVTRRSSGESDPPMDTFTQRIESAAARGRGDIVFLHGDEADRVPWSQLHDEPEPWRRPCRIEACAPVITSH